MSRLGKLVGSMFVSLLPWRLKSLWQLIRCKFPMKTELGKWGIAPSDFATCYLCGLELESIHRLFFTCVKIGYHSLLKDPLSFFISWQYVYLPINVAKFGLWLFFLPLCGRGGFWMKLFLMANRWSLISLLTLLNLEWHGGTMQNGLRAFLWQLILLHPPAISAP